MIDEIIPGAAIDSPIVLSVDGIAAKLRGVVARKQPNATLLRFDPSGAAAKVVRDLSARPEAA